MIMEGHSQICRLRRELDTQENRGHRPVWICWPPSQNSTGKGGELECRGQEKTNTQLQQPDGNRQNSISLTSAIPLGPRKPGGGHPILEGQDQYLTEPTHSNANLIWKHPHSHLQKSRLSQMCGHPVIQSSTSMEWTTTASHVHIWKNQGQV